MRELGPPRAFCTPVFSSRLSQLLDRAKELCQQPLLPVVHLPPCQWLMQRAAHGVIVQLGRGLPYGLSREGSQLNARAHPLTDGRGRSPGIALPQLLNIGMYGTGKLALALAERLEIRTGLGELPPEVVRVAAIGIVE